MLFSREGCGLRALGWAGCAMGLFESLGNHHLFMSSLRSMVFPGLSKRLLLSQKWISAAHPDLARDELDGNAQKRNQDLELII